MQTSVERARISKRIINETVSSYSVPGEIRSESRCVRIARAARNKENGATHRSNEHERLEVERVTCREIKKPYELLEHTAGHDITVSAPTRYRTLATPVTRTSPTSRASRRRV